MCADEPIPLVDLAAQHRQVADEVRAGFERVMDTTGFVLGEDGFSEVLDAASAPRFLWHGFYGLGDGDLGAGRLAEQLRALLADAGRRAELGAFARELVTERFSLAALGR